MIVIVIVWLCNGKYIVLFRFLSLFYASFIYFEQEWVVWDYCLWGISGFTSNISKFPLSRLAVLIKNVSRFSSLFMRTVIDNVRIYITNKKIAHSRSQLSHGEDRRLYLRPCTSRAQYFNNLKQLIFC